MKLSKANWEQAEETIRLQLETAIANVKPLHSRWSVLTKMYEGYMEGEITYEQDSRRIYSPAGENEYGANVHIPLIQPIVSTIQANLRDAVMRFPNYCSPSSVLVQKPGMEDVADMLQFCMNKSGIDSAIDRLAKNVGLLNIGVLKLTFDVVTDEFLVLHKDTELNVGGPIKHAGFNLEVIAPEDLVVYPRDPGSVSRARMIGHKLPAFHKDDILDLIDAGVLSKKAAELDGGDLSTDDDLDLMRFELQNAFTDGDEFHTLYTGLVKLRHGGKQQWYEFYYSLTNSKLVALQPYNAPRPNYFIFSIEKETPKLIPSNSVGNQLQGLQILVNEAMNLAIDGIARSIYPAWFVQRGAISATEELDLSPGSVNYTNGEPANAVLPKFNEFNVQGLLALVSSYEQLAEKVARVSSNDMATSYRGQTTATEAAQIAAGSALARNSVVASFGETLAEVWGFAQWLLAANWELFTAVYGQDNPISQEGNEDLLSLPIAWELTGKNSSSSPEIRQAASLQLIELGAGLAAQGYPVLDLEMLLKTYIQASGLTHDKGILKRIRQGDLPGLALPPGNEAVTGGIEGETGQFDQNNFN